jgi:plasmid stabilization system protein ParE
LAQIVFTEELGDDLERLQVAAPGAWSIIESAIAVLADHPFIGRVAEMGFRELVISRGKTGYVALYVFDEALDQVVIHAVRHQRETGL